MRLYLINDNGETYEIQVESKNTIEEMKNIIKQKTNLFPENQILKYKNSFLKEGTLESLDIIDEDQIHLSNRVYESEVCGIYFFKT
jgi:hypothetical protein